MFQGLMSWPVPKPHLCLDCGNVGGNVKQLHSSTVHKVTGTKSHWLSRSLI